MCLKKIVKRGAAFLCGLALILSCAAVTASAQTTTEAALEQLMEEYNGTYWTTDSSPSDSSGSTSQNYYGIQCKGFANYIFYRLFGVTFIGRYDGEYYYLPDPSGAVELAREWDFASDDTQLMQQIFADARPGDFIQGRSRTRSSGHTMIYVSQDEAGITVFDCNWDNRCGVQVRTMSWEKLASYFRGLSLYTAENYPQDQVDTQSPVILLAQAEAQQEGYTVTCTITDDVGVTQVYFPSWHSSQNAGESAVWYPVASDGEEYTLFIPYQTDEAGQPLYGIYYTHIYAYDATGNVTVVGVSVERPQSEAGSEHPDDSGSNPQPFDINRDGILDVLDAMTLAQYIVNEDAVSQPDWDFDGDGLVDVTDVMALCRVISDSTV